jgi:ankyrin repeat protein
MRVCPRSLLFCSSARGSAGASTSGRHAGGDGIDASEWDLPPDETASLAAALGLAPAVLAAALRDMAAGRDPPAEVLAVLEEMELPGMDMAGSRGKGAHRGNQKVSGASGMRRSESASAAAPPAADAGTEGRRWLEAAKAGQLGTLQSMLARAPALWAHRGPGLGHTALHWAAAHGDVPMLAWLLAQPAAEVNVRNSCGATACHAAAGNDAAEALQALLSAGADISARDESGETPRDVALRLKRATAIAALDAAAKPTESGSGVPCPVAPPLPAACKPHRAAADAPAAVTAVPLAAPQVAAARSERPDAVSAVPVAVAAHAAPAPAAPVATAAPPHAAVPARDAAAAAAEAADAAAAAVQALEALPDVGSIEKDVGRAWLEAARCGDAALLTRMLAQEPRLLYYWGAGTNFGFTGHSALHWAAAKGHAAALRVLLAAGAHPDVPNNGGARALHAAAANDQVECVRILLLEGGAAPALRNGLEETPRELALQSGYSDTAMAIEAAARASVLRELLSADDAPSGVAVVRAAQAALTAAGQDVRALTERADLLAAARELVQSLPRLARQPGDRVAVPQPKPAAPVVQPPAPPAAAHMPHSAPQPTAHAPSEDAVAVPAAAPPPPRAPPSGDDSDGDDRDPTAAATVKLHADAAKARGNAAFAAGQFVRAITAYSMALRLDRGNAVLLSNRSAARAAAGDYAGALEDADRAVRASPKWGKAHARRGAALVGLGQAGEAVKAYLAGLAAEPGAEYLREGLEQAKQAIRAAQTRYTEMWGGAHPGTPSDD